VDEAILSTELGHFSDPLDRFSITRLMLSNFSNFSARDMHGFRQLLVENISSVPLFESIPIDGLIAGRKL
jgi:hypothetical protein